MEWGQGTLQKGYLFGYNNLSQLVSATYFGSSETGSLSERYAYDRNGNMTLLNRNSQNIAMNLIGNRLMAISGKSLTYDAKGRQISSAYGVAVSTQYNILDLPQRHTIGNRSIIVDYAYSADGRKLQERVYSGSGDVVRDYAGEFIYENGELKKILFDGGEGIMSYSQDELRTDNVSQNNLQQMLDSPVGQEDWLSMFFKIK